MDSVAGMGHDPSSHHPKLCWCQGHAQQLALSLQEQQQVQRQLKALEKVGGTRCVSMMFHVFGC